MPKQVIRRKAYKKKKPTRYQVYSAAGSQLWKDVKMLKNLINTEFKFFDTTVTSTATTTPVVQEINVVASGDSPQQFDGMQYRMKSLHASVNLKQGSTPAPAIVKMWWIIDIDCLGGTPLFTDIFTFPIAGQPTVVHRNLGNKTRFLILKEMTCVISPNGDAHAQESYYRKLDAKVQYDATGAVQRHNRLLFVYCSDQAGASAPIISAFNRIRFIDN